MEVFDRRIAIIALSMSLPAQNRVQIEPLALKLSNGAQKAWLELQDSTFCICKQRWKVKTRPFFTARIQALYGRGDYEPIA
jgi:hypothetical protein